MRNPGFCLKDLGHLFLFLIYLKDSYRILQRFNGGQMIEFTVISIFAVFGKLMEII